MANWLFKTEPGDYSYADLERDGHTVWDGVGNNWALKNLREVKAVDVEPVRAWTRPVKLAEVKADPAFADFALVRFSRLSVMPVETKLFKRLERMGR